MELKKLTDAEFAVMRTIWSMTPPVTSTTIADRLPVDKQWKAQTVLTLLLRMEKKGYVCSEKTGKERHYIPLISEEEYMTFEAEQLSSRYGKSSFASFVGSLYKGKKIKEEELQELEKWLEEK